MAARLTDKQKKQIIADYVELGSYNAVSKKCGVSATTVRKTVLSDPESVKKCEDKKDANTADILAHMEKKKHKVNEIIDTYLDKLLDPKTIEKSTASQLTTALGTLIDKFTAVKLKYSGQKKEDDAVTKALKEIAEELNDAD